MLSIPLNAPRGKKKWKKTVRFAENDEVIEAPVSEETEEVEEKPIIAETPRWRAELQAVKEGPELLSESQSESQS